MNYQKQIKKNSMKILKCLFKGKNYNGLKQEMKNNKPISIIHNESIKDLFWSHFTLASKSTSIMYTPLLRSAAWQHKSAVCVASFP